MLDVYIEYFDIVYSVLTHHVEHDTTSSHNDYHYENKPKCIEGCHEFLHSGPVL